MLFLKNKNKINEELLTAVASRNLWQDAWMRFKRNKAALRSLYILFIICLYIFLVPLFSNFSYSDTDWSYMQQPPSFENGHYLGSDDLGRDLLVRSAIGGRISLMVGVCGALVAVLFGTIYGATSGYLGGRVDAILMRFLEILTAFPFMFFVILLVTFFGRNLLLIFVAIGLVSWLDIARIVRGQTLALKQKEFIEAAQVAGVTSLGIVMKHIVPNVLGLVIVYASLLVPSMILFESFLSFLGLGVQEPMTSWGALLQDGATSLTVAPWIILVPSVLLVITLFCFNFIGDGLRDALDSKIK